MVDIYRNRVGADPEVVLYLYQDTANTQSGAKQTRIGTSTYERIKVKSFVSSVTQNKIGDKTLNDRSSTHMFGKKDISGTIELDDDVDKWMAIAEGCEIYYKDSSEQYRYAVFSVGDQYIDTTTTSITHPNGTVLNRYNIVASTATGGAWCPTELVAGSTFLPQGPPKFYMKAVLHPNTADETTVFFTEVMFSDFKENASTTVRSYTVEFSARRTTGDSLVKA